MKLFLWCVLVCTTGRLYSSELFSGESQKGCLTRMFDCRCQVLIPFLLKCAAWMCSYGLLAWKAEYGLGCAWWQCMIPLMLAMGAPAVCIVFRNMCCCSCDYF